MEAMHFLRLVLIAIPALLMVIAAIRGEWKVVSIIFLVCAVVAMILGYVDTYHS